MKFKVILPIGLVPTGYKVTKKTGEKEYTVLRQLTIWPYKSAEKTKTLKTEGCSFLSAENDISIVDNNVEVKAMLTIGELELIQEQNLSM